MIHGRQPGFHKQALDGYLIPEPRSGTTSWPRRGLAPPRRVRVRVTRHRYGIPVQSFFMKPRAVTTHSEDFGARSGLFISQTTADILLRNLLSVTSILRISVDFPPGKRLQRGNRRDLLFPSRHVANVQALERTAHRAPDPSPGAAIRPRTSDSAPRPAPTRLARLGDAPSAHTTHPSPHEARPCTRLPASAPAR